MSPSFARLVFALTAVFFGAFFLWPIFQILKGGFVDADAALLPALAAGRADLGMADAALGAAAGVALYLLLLMFSAVGALVASAPKQG